MKTLESLQAVLEYIFDHEQEDFYENPSTGHVYYHALVVKEGEIFAQNEILSAKMELGE